MKRNLLSASAISLMMLLTASCAKNDILPGDGNDVNNSDQIAFRTSTGKTRANDNSLPEVKGGFHVIALDKTGGYVSGFANPASDNVTYFFDAGAWGWKDAASKDSKTWPTTKDDYPLTFLAAYPANTAITKDATTVAASVTPNITANTGFLYNTYFEKAVNTITATALTIDELSALSVVNGRPVSGFADLTFKHIMSAVAFDVIVPTDYTAEIQSIKIANINKSGRTYDYAKQSWSTETAYGESTHAHFAHCNSSTLQEITSDATTVNGFTDAAGFNTLKLMPQTAVAKWTLGADATVTNSFKKDADAWVTAHKAAAAAAAIEAWHTKNTGSDNGMKNSKGWEGARIEVIYRLIDNNNKVVIGQKKTVSNTAGTAGTADRFVRVGYVLDLAALEVDRDENLFGFQPGYRYTFQIPLGMAGATNGILLDPDYKDANGDSTDEPVDNPKVNPGDPVTGGGLINFNVTVDDWIPKSVEID